MLSDLIAAFFYSQAKLRKISIYFVMKELYEYITQFFQRQS